MSIEKKYSRINRLKEIEYTKRLEKIYDQISVDIAQNIRNIKLKYPDSFSENYFFRYNKTLEYQIDHIMQRLNGQVYNLSEDGILEHWANANNMKNEIIENLSSGIKIPVQMQTNMFNLNLDAMNSFLRRSVDGMNLSDRVWLGTTQAKNQIELMLGSGIAEGKSAVRNVKNIKSVLKEPNKLFRRVRNKQGKLVLSSAAKKYHPGRGVYRSSFKNAMRLIRTENNMAFRKADYMRNQQLAFVQGITIELSAAHDIYDICDEMQGDYPRDFVFIGWHSQCWCYQITKIPTKEEFAEYLQTGKLDQRKYTRSMPQKAKKYIKEKKSVFENMKNKPYFLEDNFDKDYNLKSDFVKK